MRATVFTKYWHYNEEFNYSYTVRPKRKTKYLLDQFYLTRTMYNLKWLNNLGVLLHTGMREQDANIVRSPKYHLTVIRRACKILSTEAAKLAMHTVATSTLNYCNRLLIGINKFLITRLRLWKSKLNYWFLCNTSWIWGAMEFGRVDLFYELYYRGTLMPLNPSSRIDDDPAEAGKKWACGSDLK